MFERILLGTDGSEAARNATEAALRLARATGAELRAVHALHRPVLYAAAPTYDPRVREEREGLGRSLLAEVRERGAELGISTSSELREGSPGDELLAEAESWKADLIVAGTHGHGQLSRAILGSVTDQLVRQARTPVLTVRQRSKRRPEEPLDRLLVASDGSPAALAAGEQAIELAEATGASVDLLHAIAPEMEGGKYLDRPASEIEDVHEELAARALDPLGKACRRVGVGERRFVPHGPPHRAIVEHAEAEDVDVVVVAARGHGRLERALVGSVTDKLLRTSPRPLLTVPSGRETEA